MAIPNSTEDTDNKRLLLLESFFNNKFLAHDILFAHRRKNISPPFHQDLLRLFYSDTQYAIGEAFRGGAKSTLMEEYVIMCCLFKVSKFTVIIGNSYDRACERLSAIKHELENNDMLIELFGSQIGPIWSADTLVLSNGSRIQAFGARQALRGAKHGDDRPDLAVVDDLEDEDSINTELARHKCRRWFDGALVPALIPTGKIRMVGTPLHPKSLLEEKRAAPGWKSVIIPVSYIDTATGLEVSSWPDRFTMKWINDRKQSYIEAGAITEFEQEYMCRAEDKASKPFNEGMFKAGTFPTGFYATEVMVDPARTINTKTSARTGYAVWSWVGNKLYVREAYGRFHRPDEIINEIFRLNSQYNPVNIGVEADGLEEFIMQPLRAEQVRRGCSIPLSPQRAPKDKPTFISGLQPFYMAGDVVHVENCKDLENELTAFPTGRCDVPNALAYALKMRVGKPVYEDFAPTHVIAGLETNPHRKTFLAISATPSMTAAVFLQFKDGVVYVTHDWCRNEPAQEALPLILQEAALLGLEFQSITPAEQLDRYTNNGIPAVFKGKRSKLLRGHLASESIGSLTKRLKTTSRGLPTFMVSDKARWVVNGMARGYARKLQTDGSYAPLPERNQYALVLEALESFALFLDRGMVEGDDDTLTRSTNSGGRTFYSALPQRD
jgi:hypothetical protein